MKSELPSEAAIDLGANQCTQNPYPIYRMMRERYPVCRLADGSYAISRYRDAKFALSRHDLFAPGWIGLPMYRADWPGGDYRRGLGLVEKQPPQHREYRSLVYPVFARRNVDKLVPGVVDTAQSLLKNLAEQSDVDFLEAFANPFASFVISQITGLTVEQAQHSRVCQLMRDATATEGSDEVQRAEMKIAFREQVAYFETLLKDRREKEWLDLGGVLGSGLIDGRPLSEWDTSGLLHEAVIAGYEQGMLIANGIVILANNPDIVAALKWDNALIPGFVEELLRYDSTIQGVVRVATEDVRLQEATIPAHSLVLIMLSAANRDEAQFEDPDRFVLSRPNVGTQLALGHGIHTCIGNVLARLGATIALTALVNEFEEFNCPPSEELSWAGYKVFRALQSLPVTFR